jgi:hypothetical protein
VQAVLIKRHAPKPQVSNIGSIFTISSSKTL